MLFGPRIAQRLMLLDQESGPQPIVNS
jgi:hypothetical protein